MTKADIVNEIAKNTGIGKEDVLRTLEAFIETVKGSLQESKRLHAAGKTDLAKEHNVYLRGFGSFIVKTRAQKTARNISKSTTIIIPEHSIPAFKPSKEFIAKLK
ncbi:MAG: HU family DNA-binding protein [Paludibacteraceae bacterium]